MWDFSCTFAVDNGGVWLHVGNPGKQDCAGFALTLQQET